MDRAAAVIEAARACRETPFHHQGRQPGVGLDCAGLMVHAFSAAGLRTTDRKRYGREPDPAAMRAALEEVLVLVPVTDAWQPADVLWMRFLDDPQHLALWTGATIVHAYLRVGRVVEHRLDGIWQARIVARYRHRGLVR